MARSAEQCGRRCANTRVARRIHEEDSARIMRRAWKVDYASFRSIEERGRDLPLKKRNDLLHVDAFPTRPVFGDLILRCFTNVNPEQSREWMTSDPFGELAPQRSRKGGTGVDSRTRPVRSLRQLRRATHEETCPERECRWWIDRLTTLSCCISTTG